VSSVRSHSTSEKLCDRTLQNGLNLLAVQSYYQTMAIGAVLIFAVFIDQYQLRKAANV